MKIYCTLQLSDSCRGPNQSPIIPQTCKVKICRTNYKETFFEKSNECHQYNNNRLQLYFFCANSEVFKIHNLILDETTTTAVVNVKFLYTQTISTHNDFSSTKWEFLTISST